jgi:hypothetical protein
MVQTSDTTWLSAGRCPRPAGSSARHRLADQPAAQPHERKLTKAIEATGCQVDMDQERSEKAVRDMLTSKRKDSPIQRGFNADVLLGTREID